MFCSDLMMMLINEAIHIGLWLYSSGWRRRTGEHKVRNEAAAGSSAAAYLQW
jgi:hypothetical protein